MLPTTADAVEASLACARAVGLPASDPLVVAEGFSVRVRLRPAPVVTRVVTAGRLLRGRPRPWLEREVSVAAFLASLGAPVAPPWRDAGPHLHGGLEVTLWEWVEHTSARVSQEALGRLVGGLHADLASYDGVLPVLVGPLTDIATGRSRSRDPVLHRAAETLVPLALSWPRRALHGDVHTGNVLVTDGGPVWIDLEDVCSGPAEWDLASRTVTGAAVAAYPGVIDRARLVACRDLRALQILASLLAQGGDDDPLRDDLVRQLTRDGGPAGSR